MVEAHRILGDFFANMFFITFPLFLNFIFLKKMPSPRRKLCTVLGGSILFVLIMLFPISLYGHSFDLSRIPLIVGFLYSGQYAGFGLYLLLVSARFLLIGMVASEIIFVDTMIFMILFIIEPYFKKLTIKNRIFSVIGLNMLASILTLFSLTERHPISYQLIYVSVSMFVLHTFAAIIIIFFIEKITEQARLRDRLNQAEKLEVVSQLAASISHEVRNPLTVSMGFLQLLNENDVPDNKKREFINLALEEMARANHIITGYLSFAKPTMEKPEFIDVGKEIKRIVEIITPYANMQSVEIKTTFIEAIYVIGERQKVQQCLINLTKNSIEAMPNGGILKIDANVDKNLVKVKISDTGVGMSKEEIKRLGQPYFSTKEKGTGLGMMVVNSIVKAMGGTIEINSKELEGTVITIVMPIQQKVENSN